MHSRRRFIQGLAGSALAVGATGRMAHAQASWPTKPIRMLMPFAPGSGFDGIVRWTCAKLSDELGQQFVVENMPGASGVIASAATARAAPDGYTMIFQSLSSAVVIAKAYAKLPYDPEKDLVAVSMISQYPLVMIVHPGVPAKDIKEFIALLKANPNKYSYGSSGIGSGQHLAVELFKMLSGTEIVHVPYKGTAPAATDLIAGRIHMMIEAMPSTIPRLGSGQVRALAITTTTRSPALPDLPTLAEAGLKGYEIPFWNGIYAPRGTPKEIIDKLAAACAKVVKDPATVARFKDLGAEGVGSSPQEFDRFWREQLALYGRIVASSGVKLEMN